MADQSILIPRPLDLVLAAKLSGIDPYDAGGRQPKGIVARLEKAAAAHLGESKSQVTSEMARRPRRRGQDRLTGVDERLRRSSATLGLGALARHVANAGDASRKSTVGAAKAVIKASEDAFFGWRVFKCSDRKSNLSTFFAAPPRIKDPAGGTTRFRRADGSYATAPRMLTVQPEYGTSGGGPRTLLAARAEVAMRPQLQGSWDTMNDRMDQDLGEQLRLEYDHALDRLAQGRSY